MANMTKRVNQNAGKVSKYRPGEISQNFGEPNMAAPGAGISGYARIRSQVHNPGSGMSSRPTDKSSMTQERTAPGMSVGNQMPHPAGDSGPSSSIAGRGVNRTMSYPGDGVEGRRGGATQGMPAERYRKKY